LGRKKGKTEAKKVKAKVEEKENDNELDALVDFLSGLSKPKYNFTSVVIYPFHNTESAGIQIHWTCEDHGFGTVTFYISDGKIELDTHYNNAEFVAALMDAAMKKLVDKVEVIG
jgi:hypothetical protein